MCFFGVTAIFDHLFMLSGGEPGVVRPKNKARL